MIKAIVFDMDGVLIDAKDWHYSALNRALGLFGMEISRYDHLVTYDGLPTRKKLEMISLERGLPRELHDFINKMKQQYTIDEVNQKCKPTFAHEYALSRLKTEGYRLALCSNSIRSTIELMLSKAMIDHNFDLCLSNQDVVHGKPDPEIYTKCMSMLGIEPNEALILEDNDHGVRAALASGAHLLQVANVQEVTYFNIMDRVLTINKESSPC